MRYFTVRKDWDGGREAIVLVRKDQERVVQMVWKFDRRWWGLNHDLDDSDYHHEFSIRERNCVNKCVEREERVVSGKVTCVPVEVCEEEAAMILFSVPR